MTTAWLGALWQRVKQMPKYEEVIKPATKKSKVMATNYHKIERLSKEKGLKLPKSFIEEKAKSAS